MADGRPTVTKEALAHALSESGFLLEAAVARRLRTAKWFVSHAHSYRDTDTGKTREIDLVASKTYADAALPGEFTIQLILECKAIRSGLIVLGRPLERWYGMLPAFICQGTPNSLYGGLEVMMGKKRMIEVRRASEFLDLDPVFPPAQCRTLGHQVLRIDSHNPKRVNLSSALTEFLVPVARAAIQVAGPPPDVPLPIEELRPSASDARAAEPYAGNERKPQPGDITFRWKVVIPALIIEGPLFSVNTDSTRVKLRPARSAVAMVDAGGDDSPTPVMIMHLSYLTALLTQCDVMQSHCLTTATKCKGKLANEYMRLLRRRLDSGN